MTEAEPSRPRLVGRDAKAIMALPVELRYFEYEDMPMTGVVPNNAETVVNPPEPFCK